MTPYSGNNHISMVMLNISNRYSRERLTGGGKRYLELTNQVARQGVRTWWVGPRPVVMPLEESVVVVDSLDHLPAPMRSSAVVVFDETEFATALRVVRRIRGRLVVCPRGNKLVHNPRGPIRSLIKKLIITWFYRQANALVFQTGAQAAEFTEVYRIRRPVFLLPNSIRASWIRTSHVPKSHDGLTRVGFIGDGGWRKGFDIFKGAADALSGTGLEFHCLGVEGIEEQQDAVTCWGYRNDVGEFLEAMDLMVIPSRYDSFPNVLLEAIAMDVPVLTSDTPIFREIAGSPELMFDGSVSGLVERLRTLVTDCEKYALVCNQSRALRKQYDFDWGAEFVKILQRIIND